MKFAGEPRKGLKIIRTVLRTRGKPALYRYVRERNLRKNQIATLGTLVLGWEATWRTEFRGRCNWKITIAKIMPKDRTTEKRRYFIFPPGSISRRIKNYFDSTFEMERRFIFIAIFFHQGISRATVRNS